MTLASMTQALDQPDQVDAWVKQGISLLNRLLDERTEMRARLRLLEGRIELLRQLNSGQARQQPDRQGRGPGRPRVDGMRLTDRVLQLVQQEGALTAKQLVAKLGGSASSVGGTLTHLVAKGRLARLRVSYSDGKHGPYRYSLPEQPGPT